ncbi:hypothetical protein D3C75_397580 [compost metagenome]
MKFTASYMSGFSTFEQITQLKKLLLSEFKDILIHDELEWVALYSDNPEVHFDEYGFKFNGT